MGEVLPAQALVLDDLGTGGFSDSLPLLFGHRLVALLDLTVARVGDLARGIGGNNRGITR
ncbi:hypothetical protein GCM10009533_62620 [Saccharopolyspora spinosporotrichia]|uniref:Uncharacterized protein n=1 Tax=Saccharopolyspora erythraea TaxID=1836 RepID=A0ABN1E115_SACER